MMKPSVSGIRDIRIPQEDITYELTLGRSIGNELIMTSILGRRPL